MRTIIGTFPDKMIEDIAADAGRPGPVEWQTFTGRPHRRYASNEPRITLGPKGMFYFNYAALRALGEPMAVELMMDKKRRVIGMRPTDPRQNKSAFTLKKHGSAGNYKRIAASAFCQHFRLYTPDTLLFHNIQFDDDGVLRLDLVNATKVGRGAR